MIGGRLIGFFLIFGLIWSFLILAQGLNAGEIGNRNFSESIFGTARSFQQIGGERFLPSNWPDDLKIYLIYNNPPKMPIISEMSSFYLPMTNNSYSISSIDPDGDQINYTIDWGDDTTLIIDHIESGKVAKANHTWSKAGTYDIRALATDSKGALSEWSKPLTVVINTPPNNPSRPSGPISVEPGVSSFFNISAHDPDGDQINYTIDWGDDTTLIIDHIESGKVAKANHTWSKAGTYDIRALATDSKGASSEWSKPLTVVINTPPNNPSRPSGPISVEPGVSSFFNISAHDPDGDQINYTIDWGDDTTLIIDHIESGKVAKANHTWSKAGTYDIRALATDSKGASSEWSKPLTVVINTPPNTPSRPFGMISVYTWASYIYSATAVDPDEDPATFTFDWGDGNASTTNYIKSGSNGNASHIWDHEGTYRIRVIAIDSIGALSPWSDYLTINVSANIRPGVPSNIYGPSTGYTGIAHNYFTLAKDEDSDKIIYLFDWGDGTTSTTGIVNSGSVECAQHAWDKAGIYQIRANSIDSKGASSVWSESFNVSIAENKPPDVPITPSGPIHGHTNVAYEYSTSANDSDVDPVKYVFDWGDKTTSWTGFDFIKSGTVESVYHRWNKAGVYKIKAMAMDYKGAFSNWSSSMTIKISG